ncbi:hypothetical protein QA645_41950 [Bradyrhizobium sp. CIAT3101]|uniref:hypothetical protein n=1 Tax=Bradyrhizobium sp. CIAT3101 TaxID=439387 RepID=UPI0024B203B1|nr:hypothetical protein [Bradyrhizobium sp. CIAT3101]WFU80905.1 hypothetical protein QA645_41950 [Bradyrhizobium sp. CIAT3101]
MRRLAAVLFASLAIAEARGQSASSTLMGLDECFAQTRAAEAACNQADNDTTTRLGCRLRAHSAEKRCLDSLFANRDEVRQPGDALSKPRPRTLQGAPALEPVAPPSIPPRREDTTAGLPAAKVAKGWLISETTSPRDFSPLFVAKLYPLAPVAADTPGILVLRCRNEQTEMSLGTNGVWRALRGGEVEVTITSDPAATRPMRWRLAADGRTAFMPEDPVNFVRGLGGGTTSISVTDGTGHSAGATFDLIGIDIVRARLASACRWPNVTVESRGR